MSTTFVSKLVGGAALGTAAMLFAAPGIVSASDDESGELDQTNVAVIESDAFNQGAEALVIGDGDAVALNLAAVVQFNLALDGDVTTLSCLYDAEVNGEEADLADVIESEEIESMDDAIAMLERLNGADDTECGAETGKDPAVDEDEEHKGHEDHKKKKKKLADLWIERNAENADAAK